MNSSQFDNEINTLVTKLGAHFESVKGCWIFSVLDAERPELLLPVEICNNIRKHYVPPPYQTLPILKETAGSITYDLLNGCTMTIVQGKTLTIKDDVSEVVYSIAESQTSLVLSSVSRIDASGRHFSRCLGSAVDTMLVEGIKFIFEDCTPMSSGIDRTTLFGKLEIDEPVWPISDLFTAEMADAIYDAGDRENPIFTLSFNKVRVDEASGVKTLEIIITCREAEYDYGLITVVRGEDGALSTFADNYESVAQIVAPIVDRLI